MHEEKVSGTVYLPSTFSGEGKGVRNRLFAGGMIIFEHVGDYKAFELVLQEAVVRTGMRILAYCIMPNHWHKKKRFLTLF